MPHHIMSQVGRRGKKDSETYKPWSRPWGKGTSGDTSKKWVEQTSKAEDTLLIVANALGGDG